MTPDPLSFQHWLSEESKPTRTGTKQMQRDLKARLSKLPWNVATAPPRQGTFGQHLQDVRCLRAWLHVHMPDLTYPTTGELHQDLRALLENYRGWRKRGEAR